MQTAADSRTPDIDSEERNGSLLDDSLVDERLDALPLSEERRFGGEEPQPSVGGLRVQLANAVIAQESLARAYQREKAARHQQEELADQIFESLAHVHRRELRARKRRATAESILRNDVRYRAGVALFERATSLMSWMRAAWSLYWTHARGLPVDTEPRLEVVDPVTFDGGKDFLFLPLTVKDEFVQFPSGHSSFVLSVTYLGKRADARASFELELISASDAPSIAGNESLSQQLAAAHVQCLNVNTGQCVQLHVMSSSSGSSILRIRRLAGLFGVLRIERNADAAAFVIEGKQAPSIQLLSSSSDGQTGTGLSEIGSGNVSLPPLSLPELRVPVFSAAELELKLWGGFARYALPELEALAANINAPVSERQDAAWYLTRWYFVEGDYARALENLELSRQLRRPVRLRAYLAEIQCLIKLSRFDEADAVAQEAIASNGALDLLLIRSTVLRHLEQSRGRTVEEAEKSQLEAINAVLVKVGLAPIQKRQKNAPLSLGNIVAHARSRIVDQSWKVSIVVPAFNCSATIEWVLHSILNQTWRNIEVIVVDDLSTDNTCEIVGEIADRDPRVRLIRKSVNEGAYATRNAGVRLASGDFVMVHDSDDWSHPERVERQLRELLSNPQLVAVKSFWVRVSSELDILGAWITRGTVFDLNFSSLLVRREALAAVGLWDNVLVSGDAELYSRLRTLYGENSVGKLPRNHLLALSLTREDSLTRSKATHLRSLFYGLRWNYRDAYLYWHERLRRKTDRDDLPFDSSPERRPFPTPLGIRPGAKDRQEYDIVVIADFSLQDDQLRVALDYAISAVRCGRKVAVFNWPLYTLFSRAPLRPELYDMCLKHSVDILSPGDSVKAGVLIAAMPIALQYRLDPLPDMQVDEVVVLVHEIEDGYPTQRGCRYDPRIVRAHLRTLFGTDGVWITAAQPTTRFVQHGDGAHPLNKWLPLIDVTSWGNSEPRWRGDLRRRPVVGRHVADPTNWPADRDELAKAYGASEDWDVRFMGAPDHVAACMGTIPAHWEFRQFDPALLQDFLRDLDCFVCFPKTKRAAGSERVIIEAMAVGVPVIAHPALRQIFADAAAYAEFDAVATTLFELWTSKERYMEQVERGRMFVKTHCEMSLLEDRLAQLRSDGSGATRFRRPCARTTDVVDVSR